MTDSNTALVLVPGLACDEAVWEAQVAALSKKRQLIVAGHGSLDSISAMAQALLDQAPRRFALAAHSMGGRVALEIVRRAPQRVERLALLDTGFEPLSPGAAGEQEIAKRRALLDLASTEGMRAVAVEWTRGMVHPDRLSDRHLIEAIHEMISRKSPEQFAAQIRALIHRPDAGDVLTMVRCPTLVLCGREDAWSPWSRHVEIARRIGGSVLVGVDHCGHMSPMEQPNAVTQALRDWLA